MNEEVALRIAAALERIADALEADRETRRTTYYENGKERLTHMDTTVLVNAHEQNPGGPT